MPAVDTTVLSAPVVTAPAVAATAQVQVSPVVATPAMAEPSADVASTNTSTSMAKLQINASQETWVSVVDADGKQIYDKIIFAGSRESVDAKLPISVVVGNAGGASLNLNGKIVDLGPHIRNNVARVKLE